MTKLSMSEEEMLKRKYTRPYENRIADLEKENAELEAYNKKLLQSDIDKQNKIVLLSQKVNDLQKENTEFVNDMKTNVSLLERSVEISKSLTKAEDLLKQWLKLYNTNTVKGIIADTEQFLKEE